MGSLSIQTPYSPHPKQLELHTSKDRFRVVICGRQWGKTVFSEVELSGGAPQCHRGALQTPNGEFWHISRTTKHAKRTYRRLKRALAPVLGRKPDGSPDASDTELRLRLVNNAIIECRSADRPDLLVGATLDGVVIDECTLISGRIWSQIVSPMLLVKKGWALFTGTARGKQSWIYPLFLKGQKREGGWRSWTGPCTDNPHITEEELALWRSSLPEAYFLQEYMAVFLDDAVAFFQRLDDAYENYSLPSSPMPTRYHVMGVDLAQAEDYTVLAVLEINPMGGTRGTARLVDFHRWRRVDWTTTKNRILGVSDKWEARAAVDATSGSVGSPIVSDLDIARKGRFTGFQFTQRSKDEILEGLAVALESGWLKLPGEPGKPKFEVLDEELRGYGWVTTRSGGMRPGPRDGGGDDAVMGLALAVHAARKGRRYSPVNLADFGTPAASSIFDGGSLRHL